MIKVMIVDDEEIFREYLYKTIEWEHYGLTVCCMAKNGREAMQMAREHFPDIVLVDINMPFMDGLELSGELKKNNTEIKIIIITGYSEFEYAKKAVKIGVEDYILKPIEKDELISTLEKIKDEILREREDNNRITVIKKYLDENMSIIREHFLNELLVNEMQYSNDELFEQMRICGIDMKNSIFIVSVIEIDEINSTLEHEDRNFKMSVVADTLNNNIKTIGSQIIFNGPESMVISLISFPHIEAGLAFTKCQYEKISHIVEEEYGFTITVGMGRIYKGLVNIKKSYIEAYTALKNKFTYGTNKVICYSELIEKNERMNFYSTELNDYLVAALRANDIQGIEKSLEEIFAKMKTNRINIDYAFVICMSIISNCISYIINTGNKLEDIFGRDFYPFNNLKNMKTLDEAYSWIVNLFKETLIYCNQNKMTRSKKIVESVKGYINEHLSDSEMSIESIAKCVYINPGHLRNVFKKVTGLTVIDYLTDARMKKAKELIGKGNLKISEISKEVGYSDAGYFSKCFKKHFGISPSSYENIKKES